MAIADSRHLVQEQLVTKDENPNPEYQRLIQAYTDNPFYDLIVKPDEKRNEEKSDQKSELLTKSV